MGGDERSHGPKRSPEEVRIAGGRGSGTEGEKVMRLGRNAGEEGVDEPSPGKNQDGVGSDGEGDRGGVG